MRVLSFDRYIFRLKFPTGFTYQNLHGFARFPGDSTVLVGCVLSLSYISCAASFSDGGEDQGV